MVLIQCISDCKDGKNTKHSIKIKDKCYTRHCGKYNWYNARIACKKSFKRLSSDMMFNASLIKDVWLGDSSCDELWLGVHKEDWLIASRREGRKS